ncbi:phosphate ABC transporter permease PstA [Spiroplasma clarkii]|uniref:phosphate ABC transporter permease PstA n=1 Tax=Spiroplasma clarkii TaxID=2139 RepID=UPI0011BAC7A0|nr:phosphate ABC transporter permease PstA [Spiroplasma clarkii]
MVQTSTDKRTKKTIESFVLKFFMMSSTAIIIAFTTWIILGVMFKGVAGFEIGAFVQIEGQRSGIFATVLVTLLLVVNTLMFALPLSLIVAVYLAEYAHQDSKFAKIIRFAINVLSSTPSIVFGVFGLSFFIVLMKIPMSVFAASLTMTIVILPPLITSFEDACTSVPDNYREAAYGMGLNKTKVIFKVVLPNAMQGIVTGTILATARIIGEAAPVYLTLGTSVRMPTEGFFSSGATLTTQIYMMAAEGSNPAVIGVAYQVALVTLVLVLGLNAFSGYVAKRLNPAYKKVGFKTYWATKYNIMVKHNYKQDFVFLGKSIKNFWMKFINVFSIKRWKIIIANAKTRRAVIKNIIGEAKKNDSKTTKKLDQ